MTFFASCKDEMYQLTVLSSCTHLLFAQAYPETFQFVCTLYLKHILSVAGTDRSEIGFHINTTNYRLGCIQFVEGLIFNHFTWKPTFRSKSCCFFNIVAPDKQGKDDRSTFRERTKSRLL